MSLNLQKSKILQDDLTVPARPGNYDVLMLDAWSRQALTTVRSLGARGLKVAALTTCDRLPGPALSSRWCRQKFIFPVPEGSQKYHDLLQQLLESTHPEVLIPASDGTIELIRQHRSQFERFTHIALAKESALSIAVNKEQTLQIAQTLGLAIPRGRRLNAVGEVTEALQEVGLPAVVKPVESWSKRGETRQESKLVTTPAEARSAVELLTRAGDTVLFQQFLPGARESIGLFYAWGQVFARFAYQVQRTNPPLGGTDVVRQSIAVPEDIGDQAERLVREIDLEGYCLVEFRRDSMGIPYLMEINPRLSAGIELAVRTGVDFPYLLYQWAQEKRPDKIQKYQVGYRMRDLGSDIAATAATILQRGRPGVMPPPRAIRDFFVSFFLPARYDYLDSRDLRPMGSAIAGWCRNVPTLIGNARTRHKTQQ